MSSNFNSNTNDNQNSRDDKDDDKSKAVVEMVDVISSVFDRLTGKEAIITYEFDNLEIDIPRAAGPRGQDLGSAKWTINGKLIIKAEALSHK